MSEEIRVLQLGNKKWCDMYVMPSNLDFNFCTELNNDEKLFYDLVFVDRVLEDDEIRILSRITKAYTVFYMTDIPLSENMESFLYNKMASPMERCDIQKFLNEDIKNFFPSPYGEKFSFKNMSLTQRFNGTVMWNGNYSVNLNGDFGKDFNQIAFWRNNIPIFENQAIEMWLEYKKTENIEVALSVTQFKSGTLSEVQQKWYFTEKELDEIVILDNEKPNGPIFVSLLAKGKGELDIIALHDRHSRRGYGTFLPGGKRHVTSDREEIFYYFDPGDRKPPLNVYFSGYKTRQGFEGYNMMKKMGCPFLLIGEPRLEGGSFYMGNEEYEKSMVDVIKKHMDELGFSNNQVILSGFSMGTYGALYYGCDILPHAMLVGKPLVNVGDIAENERIHRPGGFPTSLDVVNFVSGKRGKNAVDCVNKKFWDKFDSTDWGESKFIISYMIEDDYDSKAYKMLISHLKSTKIQVYGKGIHGRHNDATGEIASWFKAQYEQLLFEDFGRRKR